METLEERTKRLKERRDTMKRQKQEEEEKNRPVEEVKKRDDGDVFRNTQMKFNEKPAEKQMRLKRCLNALKKADIGKPSPFVGMQVGKPIEIEWNRPAGKSLEILDADGTDNDAIRFMKVGKRIMDDDDF